MECAPRPPSLNPVLSTRPPSKSTVCLVPRLGVALGILVRRLMNREEGVDKTSVPVGTHVHASSIHVLRGAAVQVHERTV